MKKLLLYLSMLFVSFCVQAQVIPINGIVVAGEDDSPLPGVNVLVKGSSNGTITDMNGKFKLNVPSKSKLVISYIGYKTQEIIVVDNQPLHIVLKENSERLNEVVVVGYGVQKKSVVTAAIGRVTAEDLSKVTPTRIDNVLKGQASGLTITQSSGQPGASSQVRIRGVGTINNSDPLYIVDGMPIDGGIDYLNPSDIQSVEILKDAASGAVYGSRAANGVILVTTKGGAIGKTKVTYDFSYGWQSKWRKRDVLDATEYAILMNEGYTNQGSAPKYADPYSYGKGTDWQDAMFYDNAPIENHQLTVSGGTDKGTYYLSLGYFDQSGIVGGNYNHSNYKRLAIRSNATYKLFETKERNWLNNVKVGINADYTRTTSVGISTNSEYGSEVGAAIKFSPLLGLYEKDDAAALVAYPYAVKDPNNGHVYTIASDDYNEITNPLAQLVLPGEKGNSDKFVSTFWGEINLWDNLKFKSSYGTDLSFWGNDGWTPKYYLGKSSYSNYSKVWSSMNRSLVWQLENVLSYDKAFGVHHIQVMLGQSAKKTVGRNVGGSNKYMIEEDGSKANIDFTTGTSANGDQAVYGSAYSPHTLASLFGRVSYDYGERYMIQATVRRDGSSNFGPGNRYATFPSVSLGWTLTNEQFMGKRPEWFTAMKLRASWGKNGNESIGQFKYVALTSSGNNYIFGNGDGTLYNGTKPSGLANSDLKWEESEQTNIGVDFSFLSNALTFTMDYFEKKTNGMLMTMPVPSYVGESKPTGNVGDMKNSGVEFDASYRFQVSNVKFKISANASYLKNKLIKLGNDDGFANYDNYQNVGTISRAQNGLPFPYFYGYKSAGIFQNWDEVNNYKNADGNLIQPKAQPGDVRFVDINGDGSIGDADRTKIGKGMPDWAYGTTFNVAWKGLDLSVMLQGTIGNDIYDATRRTDLAYINLPSYMLDRWTGEGSSNKIPRFTFSDNNGNWLSSDLFVKDGSYMRVKNVTLGYTFPQKWTNKVLLSNLRLYVQAENLLTFTKYEGFDPEISSGGTSLGIDRGVYPQARTFSVGVNVAF